MKEIFRHTDQEGDQFSVYETPRQGRDGLRTSVLPCEGGVSYVADLDSQAVTRLRDALTAWLGETIETISTPPAPDTELIERLVSQALTKVLPLHLAKAAVECGQCGAPWSDIHGYPGDPCVEPSAPVPLPARCGCGHFRRDHADECTVGECACKLTWSQVQAYLSASAPAPQCTCAHKYAYTHDANGCTYSECGCTWVRDTR